MAIARAGWPGDAHEGNWLLGPRPTAATVGTYNLGVGAVNAGLWFVMPERYDWIAPLALASLEMFLVARNLVLAPAPVCGIR